MALLKHCLQIDEETTVLFKKGPLDDGPFQRVSEKNAMYTMKFWVFLVQIDELISPNKHGIWVSLINHNRNVL